MAVVGLLTLEIYIPGVRSLKEKRSLVRPILARLRSEFNVSAAEVEDQDQLGHCVLAVVTVSGSRSQVHAHLTRVAEEIGRWRLDAELVDFSIEMLL